MKLTVLGSSSEGNSYIFESYSGQVLLLELGLKFSKIKQALNFNLSKVVGALVTHCHGDHAKGVKEAIASGVDVYMSEGTTKALGIDSGHRVVRIKHMDRFMIGEYEVLALDALHDAPETLMFVIRHSEMGLCMFLTDSYYIPYQIPGLNNILIEANFCQNIIDEKLKADKKFLRDRVVINHLSIQICKHYLSGCDLSQVSNIVLLHLSNSNSDAIRFQQEVQALTGKVTHIAVPGLVIENFGIKPF